MENYEQKYKKALGWMKSIYHAMQGADKEDAEHYFPELKESEDEKVKKAIRCYVEDMPDTYGFAHGIGKVDMLSWLEKQKNIVEEYEDKLDRCACESWDKGYKACLEKQKKEWNEEDEKMIRNINESLYAYQCKLCCDTIDKENAIDIINEVYKERNWLKSLKPKPHWKPEDLLNELKTLREYE